MKDEQYYYVCFDFLIDACVKSHQFYETGRRNFSRSKHTGFKITINIWHKYFQTY
jgi:hypothetical protein